MSFQVTNWIFQEWNTFHYSCTKNPLNTCKTTSLSLLFIFLSCILSTYLCSTKLDCESHLTKVKATLTHSISVLTARYSTLDDAPYSSDNTKSMPHAGIERRLHVAQGRIWVHRERHPRLTIGKVIRSAARSRLPSDDETTTPQKEVSFHFIMTIRVFIFGLVLRIPYHMIHISHDTVGWAQTTVAEIYIRSRNCLYEVELCFDCVGCEKGG